MNTAVQLVLSFVSFTTVMPLLSAIYKIYFEHVSLQFYFINHKIGTTLSVASAFLTSKPLRLMDRRIDMAVLLKIKRWLTPPSRST